MTDDALKAQVKTSQSAPTFGRNIDTLTQYLYQSRLKGRDRSAKEMGRKLNLGYHATMAVLRGARLESKEWNETIPYLGRLGGRHVYRLTGASEPVNVWTHRRIRDTETRLETMGAGASSLVNSTDGSYEAIPARLMNEGVAAIYESLVSLRAEHTSLLEATA
jgi:hypothetical protein